MKNVNKMQSQFVSFSFFCLLRSHCHEIIFCSFRSFFVSCRMQKVFSQFAQKINNGKTLAGCDSSDESMMMGKVRRENTKNKQGETSKYKMKNNFEEKWKASINLRLLSLEDLLLAVLAKPFDNICFRHFRWLPFHLSTIENNCKMLAAYRSTSTNLEWTKNRFLCEIFFFFFWVSRKHKFGRHFHLVEVRRFAKRKRNYFH